MELNFENQYVQDMMLLSKEELLKMYLQTKEAFLLEKSEANWLDQLANALRKDEDAEDAYDEHKAECKNIKERYREYFIQQ